MCRAFVNFWRICLGVNILINILSLGFFQQYRLLFLGFSNQLFLKSINDLLRFFTIISFLFWLLSYKSFTKNDGDLQPNYSLNICSFSFFSSFLTLFKNSSRNFNEDILRLIFAFLYFVGSVATSGSVAGSGISSRDGIFSTFFIGNNLLLKLLRIFFSCTR